MILRYQYMTRSQKWTPQFRLAGFLINEKLMAIDINNARLMKVSAMSPVLMNTLIRKGFDDVPARYGMGQ